mmetsp:Transcript_6237/g.8447  ORF Transcript_6237/g.8447 Transcript_6237/m.8447 type:complete len:179 (+) Transcript_6237:44-580(+)
MSSSMLSHTVNLTYCRAQPSNASNRVILRALVATRTESLPASTPNRRGFIAGIAVLPGLLSWSNPAWADDFEFTVVDPSVVRALKARDEAMRFQCEGGMMDCDGDRREYAKSQMEAFAAKRDGVDRPATIGCKTEEACGDDFLEVVTSGLRGITTPENFEAKGLDPDVAPNSTTYVPN